MLITSCCFLKDILKVLKYESCGPGSLRSEEVRRQNQNGGCSLKYKWALFKCCVHATREPQIFNYSKLDRRCSVQLQNI